MRTLSIALFGLLIARESVGQSLVRNGDFRADLSHWNTYADFPNSVAWTPLDRDESTDSGSAHVRADAPCILVGPNTYSCTAPALAQCVSLRPSRSYRASVSGLIPAGPDQHGFIQLAVTPYDQADCTGSILLFRTTGIPPVGAWRDASFDFSSPLGSRSARVEIAVFRDYGRSETFHAYVDQVSLTDLSLTAASVPVSSFAHFAFATLLAAAGLLRFARAP